MELAGEHHLARRGSPSPRTPATSGLARSSRESALSTALAVGAPVEGEPGGGPQRLETGVCRELVRDHGAPRELGVEREAAGLDPDREPVEPAAIQVR